jgi:hypothetical protein
MTSSASRVWASRMEVAREGERLRGRPRCSSAYCRSSRLITSKPEAPRRWFNISEAASPIQSRAGCPVRLSKGKTSSSWWRDFAGNRAVSLAVWISRAAATTEPPATDAALSSRAAARQ